MKNWKAKMFNKKAAHPKNKSDRIIELIGLKAGQTIADIGAGGGYFTLKFAEIVGGKGIVYAIDTNPKFLKFIKDNAKEKGLDNIVTILTKDKFDLPENSLDFIFLRNVTHHLSDRVKYFTNINSFLKSNGKIAIIEYKKGEKFTFHGLFKHYVPEEDIIHEMEEAGYLLEKRFDFLPEQHFLIFFKTTGMINEYKKC